MMIAKDIRYHQRSSSRNLLDVIYSEDQKDRPVLLFIHGGSWMSGSKDMYSRLGENFYNKGFVTVLISYRLFPTTDVYGMVEDCKAALDWCKKNIRNYGGDPEQIFLAGHSAGGHLAAVAGLQEEDPLQHIAGFIMIDAFALSAYYYLSMHGMLIPENMVGLFGKEEDKWAAACPDKLVKGKVPPFLILTGGLTYPFLASDNDYFMKLLQGLDSPVERREIPATSHMQMIYLFDEPDSIAFREVQRWLDKIKSLNKN